MAEVASAFVTLMPSTKGFGSGIDKQISGDVTKSGKSAGKRFGAAFGPGMKIGAVAAGVASAPLYRVGPVAPSAEVGA